jgi:general nucleoside transport system ATP-binding protein
VNATPAAAGEAAAQPVVQMSGIVKQFGATTALDGVDFDLRAGEIHGLLGENGAGKTTLMNVLYGLLQPDAGTIYLGGESVRLRTPQDAIRLGIGMVHQHFMLVPTLTVAENMLLGQPGTPILRRAELDGVAGRLQELHDHYGLDVDPSARVWQLSVGEQQRVEIVRALFHGARVLVLDEPTATLTPAESDLLLLKLRGMAAEGTSIVFITHHLEEVMGWTDRISILRRGKRVETLSPQETTTRELARLMVGRDVAIVQIGVGARWQPEHEAVSPNAAPAPERAALAVEGLQALGERGTPALRGVSFSVEPGEILAIAGVDGNGQSELEEVLFGLRGPVEGQVLLGGLDVTRLDPAGRLKLGLGLVPSDRYRRGLIGALGVGDNLVFDRIDEAPFGSRFRVHKRAVLSYAADLVARFTIRVAHLQQPAATLSGGNAQRVVLARTLSRELRGLVAAQPTRGLDVSAIEFVWEQLDAVRRSGVATLLISTDLDEVFALADRCVVIYGGRFVAEWPRSEFDRERIGLAMGGIRDPAEERTMLREGIR